MSKLSLYIFLILIWCNVGFAEIYACSADLTRFGRPGEVETKIYSREGNFFYNHHDWKFKIYEENKKEIHLIAGSSVSMFIVIINKETNEFTEGYLSIEDSKENEQVSNTYGKCVIR